MPIRARLLTLAVLLPAAISAQSIGLTYHNTGISIGDSRFTNGLRLNFRDDRMELVRGVNITVWNPYPGAWGGTVKGFAIGAPVTGAREIRGFGLGLFGAGTSRDFTGFGFGGVGVGAGGNLSGITIAGVGAGAGGNMTGLTIAGIGAGAGGSMKGITFGGIGAGAGGNMTGFTFGGVGAGAGGNMKGITIGGIAAGAGGNMTGFSFGGIGAGAGGTMTGISIGGIGAGAGGSMKGIAIGGVGAGAGGDMSGLSMSVIAAGAGGTIRGLGIAGVAAGATHVRGILLASAGGSHDFVGGAITPFYFKGVDDRNGDDAYVKGVTVAAWNHIRGEQHGLSIGLLNTAWELRGWQIGLLNYAENNPKGLRLLPLFNRRWRSRDVGNR